MKKFTIFTIMFALVFSLSAQITRAPQGALIKASELGLKSKSLHEIKQNKNFENWLWLADIGINIQGGDEGFFTTYSQPIWPDSTVVTIGPDGSNPVWMHSIAAIFDARSQAYEEYLDYQLVEDYEPYVVHAIMVPAWYDFRNGQFDKLRIEVGAANIENESAFTGVMLGEDITFASMNVSVEMPNSGKSLRDGDNIAALPVEHTGPWKDNLPTGFTSNITDNDYGSANEGAAAFKETDKYIMVEFDSEAEEVEYRLKGMGTGTWEGTFSVSESANGTDWTTVETITELSTTDFSDHNSNLNSNSRFIKFNFDNKVSGFNLALSKIAISKATTTPVEYAVTFEVEGDNGTIAATVDGNDITSGDDIEENKEVVFTANPADGFQVKEWTINGVVVADNTTNSLNVTVTEAITVKVEFEAESTTPPAEFAVTFEVEGDNGTIAATVDGNSITSGDDIEENKEVVFTANPADGFQVKEWTINGVVVADNTTNSLNVTVTEAITVKVEFEAESTTPPAEFAVTFEVEGDNGTITATVDGNGITSGDDIEENKEVVFTANPADGFQVKEWTINGVVVEDNATNSLNVTVTEAITVKVEFEAESTTPPAEFAVTFEVEGDNGTITATVDGNGITSGDDIEENKEVIFTANPADGFQVKEWTINGVVVEDNATNSLNVTVTEAITVKVEFEAETTTPVEFAVTFAVEGDNGTIAATVDETEIDSGDLVEANKEVVFTATPEEGYVVKEWTINGDVVEDNATNSLNVTVTEEITVKVEFEAEEEEEVLTRPVAEWSYSEKIIFDYVLTEEDVMTEEGYAQEILIELPQPITVQPGEVLGLNITFIPTAEYETGDILQVYGGDTPNKLNSFLFFYLGVNPPAEGADPEPLFHDPLGFNLFQFTHTSTLYQTFDNQLLNQIFYPEVWGSALIGFYAEQIVGIEEADNSSISVYPNPAESVVNVKLSSNETANISIINIVGQTVQNVSTNMTQNTFDVSNLDAGIYLIRVEQSGIVYTKKVVVR